jgi:hypothetical protein
MAWLAWLVLVVAPVHGAPSHVMSSMHRAAPAALAVAQSMSPHRLHERATATGHACCDHHPPCPERGDAGHAGACGMLCGSVLPATGSARWEPAEVAQVYATPRRLMAPSAHASPPLRPPANPVRSS